MVSKFRRNWEAQKEPKDQKECSQDSWAGMCAALKGEPPPTRIDQEPDPDPTQSQTRDKPRHRPDTETENEIETETET